eukprot:gene5490-3317_t
MAPSQGRLLCAPPLLLAVLLLGGALWRDGRGDGTGRRPRDPTGGPAAAWAAASRGPGGK